MCVFSGKYHGEETGWIQVWHQWSFMLKTGYVGFSLNFCFCKGILICVQWYCFVKSVDIDSTRSSPQFAFRRMSRMIAPHSTRSTATRSTGMSEYFVLILTRPYLLWNCFPFICCPFYSWSSRIFTFFFFLVCYPVSTRMPQVLHYHSAAPSVTLQTHTVNNCFVDDGGKFLLRYAKTKRFAWTPVCLACGIDLAEMLLRVIFERDCFSLHYWQWHLCQLSLRSKLRFQIIQY